MDHDVYWCITQDGWSIRNPKTGRVVAHVPSVAVINARFVVQEGGRQRVLRERRKNVHAYVRGQVALAIPPGMSQGRQIRYNPYEMDHFQWADDRTRVVACPMIIFDRDGKVYALDQVPSPNGTAA